MIRRDTSRILLVGEATSPMHATLCAASPRSEIVAAPTVFDAIAELTAEEYSAVFCPTEPIERRPESAVATLRNVAGDARVILFGHPTLEPLARKMLQHGADDYIVTPIEATEVSHVLTRRLRHLDPPAQTRDTTEIPSSPMPSIKSEYLPTVSPAQASEIDPNIFLDALLNHPIDAPTAAVAQVNRIMAPVRISLLQHNDAPPPATDGFVAFSQPVDRQRQDAPILYLQAPAHSDEPKTRKLLEDLSAGFAKLTTLQNRFLHLKELATTDELTGLANSRWFRERLTKIMEIARKRKTPVTLLLFDIDDFKKYNDRYGHGVGDEILKQTAQLMRRCVREHDLVARIGGDEFAVIFWENQGPRTVRDPHAEPDTAPGRPPQTPAIMCKRFQSLLSKHTFSALGRDGRGTLTISGGLATAFWDAATPEELIAAADKALMFGAKRSGKNSIALVGEENRA
ncbi:MAG TPA: GGDEF domain-containing protein [Tepidisphaeraceae bacterium]|jgi:GGDEF domain-containing protein